MDKAPEYVYMDDMTLSGDQLLDKYAYLDAHPEITGYVPPLESVDPDQLFQEMEAQRNEPVSIGSKGMPKSLDYLAPARTLSKAIGNYYAQGEVDFTIGEYGAQARDGTITIDQMKGSTAFGRLERLQKEQGSLDAELESLNLGWARNLEPAVKSLHFMKEALAAKVKGAAIGGVAGGVAGAAFTAGAGTLAGAAIGATWGSRVDAFYETSRNMGGHLYADMVNSGIKPETANVASHIGGALLGLSEVFELSILTGSARQAAGQFIRSGPGKELVSRFLKDYVKNVGLEVVQEDLQYMIEESTKYLATVADDPNAAPPNYTDFAKGLVETTIQATKASAVLVGGSQVAGATAGKVTNVALKKAGLEVDASASKPGGSEMSIGDIFRLIKEGAKPEGPTSQQVAEAAAKPTEGTLDELAKPVFTEQGALVGSVRTDVVAAPEGVRGAGQQRPEFARPPVPEVLAPIVDPVIDEETLGQLTVEQKGRVQYLSDQTKQIDIQINQAEREMVSRASEGKSTTALQNKLNKLYDQRQETGYEIAAIKSNAIGPEKVEGQKITIRANRAKQVKDQIAQFRKGVKEGRQFTKKEIAIVQDNLAQFIRNSDLPPADRGKFINRILKTQTQEQLDRIMPAIQERIDKLVEADQKRVAKTRLAKARKDVRLKKGKYRESKFDRDTQKIIDTYEELIGDTATRNALVEQRMERVIDDLTNYDSIGAEPRGAAITDQYIREEIAMQLHGMETANAKQLNEIADTLEQLAATGRVRKLQQKIEEKQKLDDTVSASIESIQGEKPLYSFEKANDPLAANPVKKALVHLKRSIGANISSYDGILDILSQHDPMAKLKELLSLDRQITEEMYQIKVQTESLMDILTESTGEKLHKVFSKTAEMSKKQKFGDYVDQNGKTVPLNITKMELIKLKMQFDDPPLQKGLRDGNKYTFKGDDVGIGGISTEELIDQNITEFDQKLIEGLKKFYDKNFERLNAAWENATGASLVREQNYSGFARREGGNEGTKAGTKSSTDIMASFMEDTYSQSSIKPKSAIARTENNLALSLSNPIIDAMKSIVANERFIALHEKQRLVRAVFNNRDVRNAISIKYGEAMLRTVDSSWKNSLGILPKLAGGTLSAIDTLIRRRGVLFVGGKAIQFLKQLSSIMNFMIEVTPIEFASGSIDFMLHPKKAIETMGKSKAMQTRYFTFDRDYLNAMMNDMKGPTWKGLPNAQKVAMMFVLGGDKVTIYAGGWSVYKAALKKTGSEAEAMRAFEKAMNATQSSGRRDYLSPLETGGSMTRLLTQFAKQPLQMLEANLNAVRRALSKPTPKTIEKAVRVYFATNAAQMLFTLVGDIGYAMTGGDKDPEDILATAVKNMMVGVMSGIPYLGYLVDSLAVPATNWMFNADNEVWTPKGAIEDVIVNGGKLLTSVSEMALDPFGIEIEDLFRVAHEYARSLDLIAPIPLGPLTNAPKEPYLKMIEGAFGIQPNKKKKPSGRPTL